MLWNIVILCCLLTMFVLIEVSARQWRKRHPEDPVGNAIEEFTKSKGRKS